MINENLLFRDFALKCARAFGPCFYQREDNLENLPQLRIADTSYYEEKIKKAKAFKKPTKAEYNLYIAKEKEHLEAELKINKKRIDAYKLMLVNVKKWQPPTKDHVRFKEFMIEQLESSLNFDSCGYYETQLKKIKALTYKDYCNILKEGADNDIKHYAEEIEKEKAKTEKSNKWLTDLFDSLK
jgi:hypothetical protein